MSGEELMEHYTTVLIADNSDEFCAGLTEALQRSEGFQVVGTANDGEQALRLVAERKPDILVLDLMLSKKDGISILKVISTMENKPITLATSRFVTDYVANRIHIPSLALFIGFCCGSDDVRGNRRTNPRSASRATQQHPYVGLYRRVCTDDGVGLRVVEFILPL